MVRRTVLLSLAFILASPVPPALAEDKVNGYAEWRRGATLIVEGQLVRVHAGTRFAGNDVRSIGAIQLGYEVEVRGDRDASGVIIAREIKAKPNGDAMFESDVIEATNEIEDVWVGQGRMFEPGKDGSQRTVGSIIETGPQAERARGIMRRLTPPYVDFDRQVRVHLVDTVEWNAAAMGNGAIWVYAGLVDSMSDDELAVVLGHELAHYTHEHSRRQAKTSMWQGLLGLGAIVGAEALNNDTARGAAIVAAGLGLTVWSSGYSRDHEDQADMVGLRYAHEGGFDVGAGTRLWGKFRDRYGEADSISNFFFGSHSRPSDRIRNIEAEIARNYPSSPPWSFEPVERSRPADVDTSAGEDDEWSGASRRAGESAERDGAVLSTGEIEERAEPVRDQLMLFGNSLGGGFTPTSEPAIGALDPGASTTFEMEVVAGLEYIVFSACDAACEDLDLFVYGARGEEVARNAEADAYPVLEFEARENGLWTIRVAMVNCSAYTCVFGVQSYHGR